MKRFSTVLKPSSWCLLTGLAFAAGEVRAQDLNFSRLAGSWQANSNTTLSAIGNYYRPRGLITAAATASVAGGQVTGFSISNQGSGYTAPPSVTLTGGGGSGAVAVAVLSATGTVVSVTVVNGGSGYTSSPTVTFSAPLLGGVGTTGIFNTDITANPRLLTVDGNYTYGRMILGDLGGGEAYSFELGTGGRFTFDNGEFAGGHAFLNKFQGGADLIKTPLTINSNLIARVQANRITVSNTISGTGVLTSTGNGVLAITGNNTGTGMDLVLWNRGGGGTGAQVELGSGTGHAVSGDITVGNALRGTNGHAVLQLLQGRSNLDQIHDGSTLIFDSINGVGRNAYFKLMGGSETVGRILDVGDRAVIENRESESVGTSAVLTIGSNTAAGNLDSRINGFLRDASGSNVQQGDSNIKLGSGVTSQLGLTKQGTGDLRLVGANIIYSGNTLIANGSLTLQNTTNFRSNITNNSQLNFDVTGTLNMRKVFPTIPNSNPSRSYADEYLSVSGSGSVNKTGNGALGLFGTQNIGGAFSMDNGTVNLNASASGIGIGGALTGSGDPGLNRNLNLRGVVNVGGGLDFSGRFVNTGSSVTIGGAVLGLGDQDTSSWVDTTVNVAGSVRLNHANLILESDFSIGKTTSGGTTNSANVTVTNSADLIVGMRVTGNGVPANTTVTAIDTVRRIVTLSNSATIASATPLTFSYSTNTDGRIVQPGADAVINTGLHLADGSTFWAGNFTTFRELTANRVVKLSRDGYRDLAFATASGTGPNLAVHASALQADGKILIGGQFTSYNGTARNRIARLNADGSLDTSFAPAGGANGTVRVILPLANGKFLIAGSFSQYDGVLRNRIAQINSNGTLDTSFNPSVGADNEIVAMALDSTGRILIAGSFTSYNGVPRNRIARLLSNGANDASFDPGTGADGTVHSILVQPDGKIVIGGDFLQVASNPTNHLARLLDNGQFDEGFLPAGDQWHLQPGASDLAWTAMASSNTGAKLVALADGDPIFTSADYGITWTARETARAWRSAASSADGTKLVAVVDGGQIYTSIDSGATWTARESARAWRSVASSSDGVKLVAVVEGGEIYTSTDSGLTWTPRESARAWRSVASSGDGTRLVAIVDAGQIYTSTDSGATWTARESARAWRSVASSTDGVKLVAAADGGQIYTSTNSGVNWTARESSRAWRSVASSADGTDLVAVVQGGQVYVSTDSGVSWSARESSRNWASVVTSANGTRLAAAVNGVGIFTSARGADASILALAHEQTLVLSNPPGNLAWSAAASSASGNVLALAVDGGQLHISSDAGVNWTARDSARAWRSVASSSDGSKMVAVVNGGQIYTSTNFGVSWTARDSARAWRSVASSDDGVKLVAVVDGGQIYTSVNSGASWTARETARAWRSVASSSNGVNLVAVVDDGQIYTSTDSGSSWTARDSARAWRSVASSSDGAKLVAVVDNGQIYTSTNSGANWTARDSARAWRSVALSSDGSKWFATTEGGQLFVSLNSGVTWNERPTPYGSDPGASYVATSFDGGRLLLTKASNSPSVSSRRLYAGGNFDVLGGLSNRGVARLMQNGAVDESFYPGAGADNVVNYLLPDFDGTLVASGDFIYFDEIGGRRIVRLYDDGETHRMFAHTTDITMSGRPNLVGAGDSGSRLVLSNTQFSNNTNRIPDATPIVSNGGVMEFMNNGSTVAGANFSETVGNLVLNPGAFQVIGYRAAASRTSTLTFAGLQRNPGSILEFGGRDLSSGANVLDTNNLGLDTRNRIFFSSAPTLTNGILGGWAFANNEWVTYGANGVTRLTTYNTSANTDWKSQINVKMSANQTFTANGERTLNSLNMQPDITAGAATVTLNLSASPLYITSGGLLSSHGNHNINTGSTSGFVTAGTSAPGDRELYTIIGNTANSTGVNILTFNASIRDFVISRNINLAAAGATAIVLQNGFSTNELSVGMAISGPGIDSGTTITAISGNQLTLSKPTTGLMGAGTALSFGDSQRVSLVKGGAGILRLNNDANSYTGRTVVTNGILMLGGNGVFGPAPSSFVADHVRLDGGFLQFARRTDGSFDTTKDTGTGLVPDKIFNFSEGNRGFTIGSSGGRFEVGVNNPNNAPAGATGEPEVHVTITNPIYAEGLLELAVRATPGLGQSNTLTLGDASSINRYLGGLKTEGSYEGIVTVNGDNEIGGLLVEGGEFYVTGDNDFTGNIRMTTGLLTLSGANTFRGGQTFPTITLPAGTLRLQNAAALGTGGLSLALGGSGQVELRGISQTIREISTNATSSALISNASATPATVTFDLDVNQTYGGSLNNGGSGLLSLTKTGPGRLQLTNSQSGFSGVVRIEEGVIDVRTMGFAGTISSFGTGGNGSASQLVLNGGVLSFSPLTQLTTNRTFTLGAGSEAGTLVANGNTRAARVIIGAELDSVVSQPVGFEGSGPRTLTLGGVNVGLNTLALELGDAAVGDPTALMKIGSGVWLLGAASNYSGQTTLVDGVLRIEANYAAGTTSIPTTASAAANTLAGNLPNGVMVTLPQFKGNTLPGGLVAGQRYYVVGSTGSSFQLAATPGGAAIDLTSDGTNVSFVPNIQGVASTTANATSNTFTGNLPNGTPVSFSTRAVYDPTGATTLITPGLPNAAGGAIVANATYYLVNSNGTNGTFQIARTPGGAAIDLTTTGTNIFYSAAVAGNTSEGIYVLGGRLDIGNVDYTAPETIIFQGGGLGVPRGLQATWAGNVDMQTNASWTINAGSTLTLTGNILGNRTITQLGEGTVVLKGEALNFTAPDAVTNQMDNTRRTYTLQAGTLVLDFGVNNNSKLTDSATFVMGGGRRGGVLRLQNGTHEEIVNALSLQAGASKIYRDSGSSVIRLNNIVRQTGASLYFDQERIAKVDNANLNGILGGWAIIRDARQDAYLVIPGTVSRTFTADPATATLTTPLGDLPHFLAAGVPVRFTTTGELPAGLAVDTTYYALDTTARGFRVSTTPFGEAVQIASTGTGVHTVQTFGAQRRPGPASLVFMADPRGRAGAAGNNAIRVRITHNPGSFGPITFSFSGSGTVGVPWSFTINTTGAASSATEIAEALSSYANAIGRLKVISSGFDYNPDSNVYPAAPATWLLLDGGVDDTGRQSLSWARNGSTTPGIFNDGPVESANDFQTNLWSSGFNTDVVSSGNLINIAAGASTYTLRFANALAATVNLQGTLGHTLQTGSILVSPTVGRNDSILTGTSTLTTNNEGFLQNFLIHQYNELGDLVLDVPLVDRQSFTRGGYLSAPNTAGSEQIRRITGLIGIDGTGDTSQLSVGMTVSGTGVPGGATIAAIPDSRTVIISADLTTGDNSRNIYTFDGVTQMRGSIRQVGQNRISGVVNAQGQLATSDLYIGMPISGPGIPPGYRVQSIVNESDITIGTLNGNGITVDTNNHAYNGMQTVMTFSSAIGIEKLGPGTLVVSADSTYTGITYLGDGVLRANKLTDGGVPGSLGASTNANGNLTFNGGVLQYVGPTSTSNRGLTLFDYAEVNIGHELTTSVFNGSISGSDIFAKSGSGTLEMRGNAGLAEIRVLEGRLRVQATDLNNSPATYSQSNFGQTGLGELRLAGGALELRGTSFGNSTLTLGGQFYVDAGASEVRAVGVNGINPNNLNAGSLPRTTQISLMGGEELGSVERSAGGSVLFIEDPLVGGAVANILLNIEEIARGRILPWAVYQDTTNIAQPGVNNFAAVSLTTGAVVSADSQSQHDIGDGFMNANSWGTGSPSASLDVSEGGQVEVTLNLGVDSSAGSNVLQVSDFLSFQFANLVPDMSVFGPGIPSNTKIVSLQTSPLRIVLSQNATTNNNGATYTFRRPRAYFGTLTANRAVNTLRYFSPVDSQITVSAGNTLQLLSGAILVGANVRGGEKSIVGEGSLSGAVGSEASDLLIHNYNPVAPFTLGTRITDNVLSIVNAGTISAGSNSLRVLNAGITTLVRLRVGMSVSGPGVQPGTTISSIDEENRRVYLSAPVLSGQTAQTFSFTSATSLVQTGTGTTVLAGNNDYKGTTYVHGGVLRLDSANAVPGGIGAVGGTSNLLVKGGVVGLGHGDFTRAGGTGSAQIQFQGSGGFAAYGADRTVNLGGKDVPDILRYGNNGFVPDGSSFLLGAGDATHKTLVLNPIDLGSFSQAVRVIDGPASIEGDLAGGLIGLGKLIKFGTGSLRLSGSSSHTGGIEIAAGRLVVANVPNALGTGAGPIVLGTDLTHTAKNAAIEMVVEGGTLTKDLRVGSVNSRGADWIERGSVDTSGDLVGSQASTAVINNHPAIAYYDSTSGDLKYVRAADPRGTSWLPPVTVASRGDVGQFPSLSIVNGNPAISYYDASNKLLMFVRSTDISGVFWGNPIIVDSSPVSAIAVQSTGKIIIGGVFVEFDGQVRQRLARINTDGSLDTGFAPLFNGDVLAIVVQADDKILVAGSFTDINGTTRNRMARLNADGTLDTAYNPNFNGTVRGLLIEPDERVVVWGSFTGTNRNRVARLNADGSSDNGFNANANNEVRAVARQSDGSLVLGGTFTQVGGVDRNRIARVSSTGVLDGGFNPNFNNAVSALLVQPDGKILAGGIFSYINNGGRRRDRLARINSTGTPDDSFFLDADGEVRGFLRQADGEILLYGAFTRIGVTPRFNLARLNTDDSLDASFNPDANDEVLSVAQVAGGQLLVGGSFSNIGGGTRHFLARLTLDGQGDLTFGRQTLDRGRYSSLTEVRQAAAFNAGEARPAIAYYDVAGGLLRFTRAVDVNGVNWNPPLILDASANVGTAISMRMVNIGGDVITKNNNSTPANPDDDTVTISGIAINGTPAVAYYDATNGDLKYVLSNDPAGTDWSSPTTVHSSGDVGSHLSLASVDGLPAIAYYDAGAGLRFVRATTPGGLTSNLRDINGNILTTAVSALAYTSNWGAPVLVDGGQVGTFASLDIITDSTSAQGRPAIAYYDAAGLNLKYVRAQNVTGSAWGTPRTVVSIGDVGRSAGLVLTNGVPGIAYHDATAGDLKFLHLADATGYSRITLADGTDWQGGVTIDGDIFFNVGANALATVSGAIEGAAGIKVSGSGTLRLTNPSNTFGATLPGPAATINSAVIVRSGTLALGVNGAIGTATVELGDALPQILTVDRATTFESLTALAGRFDADHNGFFDNAGGPGAFVEIDTTIDGFTYRPETLPAEPVFILVKDERDNPQWNGVYQVIFNSDLQPDGTMNLVRVAAMDTAAELAYGTQVRVLNGTHAGRSFFIASQVDELNASAVNWVRDVADASAALLAEVAGLNISNAIDVNGNPLSVGDGSRGVLGGLASLTSGNVQFSGGVLLQNRRSGVREERNLDLQSFTSTGYGVSFTGVFAESDSGTGSTQDRLNLRKTGSGIATLTAANTFRGGVTVAEGTLLAMNSAGSATGLGTVSVNAGAVLGGTGFLGGPVNLAGAGGIQAILRPGDPTATAAVETLTLSGALTVGADSVVEFAAGAASLTRLVANSVAVTGTGRFLLTLLEDYVPAVDTIIDLVDGTINLPAGANLRNHLVLPGSLRWDTSTFLSDGTLRVLGTTVPVAIATPPAITTPTGGGPVNPGGNVTVTFTATVSGSPEFRYQWQKSPVGMNTWTNVGAPVFSTSTTATLTLTGILEADEADYRLVAVNGSLVVEDANTFTATSAPVTLVVNDPPTITQQPASVTVNPGATAVLSVTATGPGPISYQWRRGTTNLTPPTEGLSTFEIPNVQKAQQGSNYNVLISNGASIIAGPTQSNFFSLTVRDPVAVTNFPATTGVAEGDAIVLNLGHSGSGTPDLPDPGDPDFTYLWERDNGAGFAPIDGAPNAAQITLPAATPADNGAIIRVTVSNSFSSAQAVTTIAVVNPSVRSQPQSRTVLAGSGFTLEVEAGGSAEGRTYQWKRGKASLKEGAGISGVNTPVLEFTNIDLKQAGDYSCEITNAFGVRLSDPAYITVVGAPGTLVPVQTGKNITLTLPFVAPKGVTVDLKWQKDGADLPVDLRYSADNLAKFTIARTTDDDSGIYTCLVTSRGPAPTFRESVAGGAFDLRVFSEGPVLALQPFPQAMVGAWFEYQIEVDPDPARAPTVFFAKPLPVGLKLDPKTGWITGIPKAPVENMQVVLGAGNVYAKLVTATQGLTVQAVPTQATGVFAGWIPRHEQANEYMGGRIDFTVASTGALTGRLMLGATTYAFKALLELDPTGVDFPEVHVSIPRKGKPLPSPIELSFRINTAFNRLEEGTVEVDGVELDFGATTWRNPWNLLTNPAVGALEGYHTLALLPPGHPTPDADIPQGTGYAAFTATADGRLTLAGRTADGQTLASAAFLGPNGQIVVFQPLYKSKPRGSLLGHLTLDRNLVAELSDNQIVGTLSWNCPPNPLKNFLYPDGFGNAGGDAVEVTAVGGQYTPPALVSEANPNPDVIFGLEPGNDNAMLTFVNGGVEDSETNPNLDGPLADPGTGLRGWVSILAGNRVLVPKGLNANPGTTSLKFVAKTGIFSGKFTLSDFSTATNKFEKRSSTFFGIVVDEDNGALDAAQVGAGYFVLRQHPNQYPVGDPPLTLKTTPIRSGEVIFEARPVVTP